ncbi:MULTISPECIES: type II toxin-antitoxin system HicB family antitoxin [unclassified Campylobacter]|uniref:type II toxin-antitoxin system HicB family antitoxin n=1 Tax=unclassified Campylobacter TaxID=2593542 RepID=UPI003D35221D
MKDLDYYRNLPYKIELKKIADDEGGGWGAFMPEFNGVALFWGDGKTKQEALNELDLAFDVAIQGLIDSDIAIPEPTSQTSKVRVNVSLSRQILDAIDKVSKNRSAFLEDAAKMALG